MNTSIKISSIFPKHLFWDIDYENLDFFNDSDIIIPRALYLTNTESFENDIKKLEKIYTSSQIVLQLKLTKEKISNQVCEMVAKRYHVPLFKRFSI